jgi:hypothetical protein
MFGLLVFFIVFIPAIQLWFAIVSASQTVYIALWFALLTLKSNKIRDRANIKTTKKRKGNITQTKIQIL